MMVGHSCGRNAQHEPNFLVNCLMRHCSLQQKGTQLAIEAFDSTNKLSFCCQCRKHVRQADGKSIGDDQSQGQARVYRMALENTS